MFPSHVQKKVFKKRMIIFVLTTVLFVTAFIINIALNGAAFNQNLNFVPDLQTSQTWGSDGFLTFMNIVSNVFNPIICAGYILIFFLVSYRKLEILVFLIWFIFLSYTLSILKLIFHQARPYWIQDSGVQMLEWTCYTQYGMPSGHSMLAIVLMEFVVRFYARVNKFVFKYIGFFYVLIVIGQFLVMLSRVILGMHSLNQVLFGCMIGVYSFIPFYLFVERLILKWVIYMFRNPYSPVVLLSLAFTAVVAATLSILITLLTSYENTPYINMISTFSGCNGFHIYKSFQYKCMEDTALLMAAIGILVAFNLMEKPGFLMQRLQYSRFTLRYLAKFIITLAIPLIITLIFLNPLWQNIQADNQDMAFIIWACQMTGFFLSTFSLVYVIPLVNMKLGFELYRIYQSYEDYKKHEIHNMVQADQFIINRMTQQRRDTQLTEKNVTLNNAKSDTIVVNQSVKVDEEN